MRWFFLISLSTLMLAGCAGGGDLRQLPAQEPRLDAPAAEAPGRSELSLDQEAFYARLERDLLAQGLLRADGGGPDVPFTDEMVTRNFLAMAFSEEFTNVGGLISQSPRASTLHRWEVPVRIETLFSDTVSPSLAEADNALISTYAERLSRVTGHQISRSPGKGNFLVMALHEQDLSTIGPLLIDRLPGISTSEIDFVQNLPPETYCIVFTSDPGNDGRITDAVAIIRAELPDALRTSCYHEEIAQGLGLANDSDFARPSIFKDDDEFGRLTTHDEALLAILYDASLTTGMTETEAVGVVRQIARAQLAPST